MPKSCSECGTAVSEEDKFCPKCGHDPREPVGGVLPQAATSAKTIEEESSAPAKSSHLDWIWQIPFWISERVKSVRISFRGKQICVGTWIIPLACVFILGALAIGLTMRATSAPMARELAKVSEKPLEVAPVTPEVTVPRATPEVTVPKTAPAAPEVEQKAMPVQEAEKDVFGRPFLYGTTAVNRRYYPGGTTVVIPGPGFGPQPTAASPVSTQLAQPQPVQKDVFGRPFLYGTTAVNRRYYPGGTTVVIPGPGVKGG